MKRKIIFGSLLAVFLMMMLPSVPAVEYNTAVEANETRILDELQNINLEELKVKIQSIDIKSFKEELKDDPALPQCFAIPYAIIALVILCIIFGVLGALVVTVGLILSVIISIIVGVLGAIGAIVGAIVALIIKIVIALITGSIVIIGKVVSLILSILVTMMGKLFNLFVVTIGVILDILRLIYDAIFPGLSSAA